MHNLSLDLQHTNLPDVFWHNVSPVEHVRILHGDAFNHEYFTIGQTIDKKYIDDFEQLTMHEISSLLLSQEDAHKEFNRIMSSAEKSNWVNSSLSPQNGCYDKIIEAKTKQQDVYVSMQRYYTRKRSAEQTSSISSFFVDIDQLPPGVDPMDYATDFVEMVYGIGFPPPSYILSSGRGIHAVWLFNKIGIKRNSTYNATARWKVLQNKIISEVQDKICSLIGGVVDTAVKDLARVLRLSGTINSKTGDNVDIIWTAFESKNNILRYASLDDLQVGFGLKPREEYLLEKQIISLSLEKSKRQKETGENSSSKNFVTLNQTIISDLWKIYHNVWDGNIPAGKWDLWLFSMTVALSHTTHPDALASSVKDICNQIGWMNRKEALGMMGSAIRRAKKSLDNQTDERYRLSSDYLMKILDISDDDAEIYDLRYIASRNLRNKRKAVAKRDKNGWNEYGSREDYQRHRADLKAHREAEIIRMIDFQGMRRKHVSDILSIAPKTVSNIMSRIRSERRQNECPF